MVSSRNLLIFPKHWSLLGRYRIIQIYGSSPRVRGTVLTRVSVLIGVRFIPACAGNSLVRQPIRARTPVHPRVCGEQLLHAAGNQFGNGSSPRVRGTDHAFRPSVFVTRFIPACAGNRFFARSSRYRSPVHPRVCGEQSFPVIRNLVPAGSSPRVRGTGIRAYRPLHLYRFIPACAGNRTSSQSASAQIRGSSPRVRGTDSRENTGISSIRFIPACAGNSWQASTRIC